MMNINCTSCGKLFSRKDALKRHMAKIHHIAMPTPPPPPPKLPTETTTSLPSQTFASSSTTTTTTTKPCYVWSRTLGNVRQYYQYNNNSYICPTCLLVHKRFDTFVNMHYNHGQFTQSKCDTYNSCTPADELDEEEQEEEEEGPFYIWSNIKDARQYYNHHNQYLCPECETYTADFDEFVKNHQHHARAFIRPKTTYKRPSINTTASAAAAKLQRPTTTMKRQYGGAM